MRAPPPPATDPGAAQAGDSNPPLLVVGKTACPAIRCAMVACRFEDRAEFAPSLSTAHDRLAAGRRYAATLLPADQPRSVTVATVESLRDAGAAGEVAAIGGPWYEGRLRAQDRSQEPPVVYWHRLADWLAERIGLQTTPRFGRPPGVVLISSRDRDTAAAIAEQLATDQEGHRPSVVWSPRGGRAPFVSRVDAAIWVGGQLNGRATAELADFAAGVRRQSIGGQGGSGQGGNHSSGPVLVLLDFPRHDEVATALRVGATAVLAKPWRHAALLRAITPTLAGIENATRQPNPFRNAA